ncbi:ABC transporter ATP-binding protein [Treponema phagedenis]|uniref:ABC transporter ATP-binding protein n=1 Tax=Treponema phagedenis TaxID=162 RepID=UPI0011E69259|nr:ABC transporter ATP-binding protein [Treponema phagedenis]QEJ95033.1 ABC transporter ATP-binding protein [Treponema phagedenis]
MPSDLIKGVNEEYFNTEKPVKTFLHLFKNQKINIIFSALFFIVKNSPAWALPIVTANIINYLSNALQQPQNRAAEIKMIIINLAVFGVLALQNILTHTLFIYFLAKAVRNIEANLRLSIIRRLQQLSVAFHDKTSSGAIQAKVLRDVESIRSVIMVLMNMYLPAFASFILAFSVTMYKAPIISLVYAAAIPIVLLLMKLFRGRMKRTNAVLRHDMEEMTSEVSEMIAMLPVTKAHGLEDAEIAKMEKKFKFVFQNGMKLDIVSAVFGSANWVAFQFLQIACLVITVSFALAGKIGTGDVILYHGFFNLVLGSVATIINAYPDITRGMEAIRSIGDILESDEIEFNETKPTVQKVSGLVRFENVSFRYPDLQMHALDNINFTVQAGETVAFVGESGSGKSTIMQLIMGLRHPQEGRVVIDDFDLAEVNLQSFRKHIAVVPQSVVLFSGSIQDNITYGLPNVGDEAILRAAKLANALEFIEKLPEGFQTKVGEHGAKLSGGQRQRIAIARALIRNPDILIFDEATSALDVISEKLVQDAIDTMVKGKTCFIVAHRLSTIRSADKLFVLRKGEIVESGTYQELINANGEFARLQSLQTR